MTPPDSAGAVSSDSTLYWEGVGTPRRWSGDRHGSDTRHTLSLRKGLVPHRMSRLVPWKVGTARPSGRHGDRDLSRCSGYGDAAVFPDIKLSRCFCYFRFGHIWCLVRLGGLVPPCTSSAILICESGDPANPTTDAGDSMRGGFVRPPPPPLPPSPILPCFKLGKLLESLSAPAPHVAPTSMRAPTPHHPIRPTHRDPHAQCHTVTVRLSSHSYKAN